MDENENIDNYIEVGEMKNRTYNHKKGSKLNRNHKTTTTIITSQRANTRQITLEMNNKMKILRSMIMS